MNLAQTLYYECTQGGREVNIEVLAYLWECAHDMREQLQNILKCLPKDPAPTSQ